MQKTIRMANNLRLALFPIAYALSGVLIGSTLNRVMIADLGYSATLVAFFFAIPLMISPIRVWVGLPIRCLSSAGETARTIYHAGRIAYRAWNYCYCRHHHETRRQCPADGRVAVSLPALWPRRNTAHNSFQALVAERYVAEDRSRAATFYEVATMLGMVAGAGFIKKALTDYDPSRLTSVALGLRWLFSSWHLLQYLATRRRTNAPTKRRKRRAKSPSGRPSRR